VLFLDCDRFKVVNDSLGHFMGDQLLLAIARRLRALLPETIMLARLGGDEFTMLLPRFTDQASVVQIVKQILNASPNPFNWINTRFSSLPVLGLRSAPPSTAYQSIFCVMPIWQCTVRKHLAADLIRFLTLHCTRLLSALTA
jgi:diguanylate cyclase (GGDEF)-like protein